jgi:hypothetical protein
MSRTVARKISPNPILSYGLDLPLSAFTAASHGNYKLGYLADRGGASMKFFEQPIYVHAHGVVRFPKDQYGKVTLSVLPEESEFFRRVESDIMENLDRITDLAEPHLNVSSLPRKSITYENLLKLRINKMIGQDVEGKLVDFEKHEEVLTKGTKVLMTVEVQGLYHSTTGKGVMARIHSYRVVETF